jgi:two-component sensor histidine kinase
LVHQLLYKRNSFNRLEVKALLDSLADRFRCMFHNLSISFEWNGPELEIGGDRAVSLGLPVNEIVANSSKHAFGDGNGAVSIRIDVEGDAGSTVLIIGDDGKGMKPDAVEGMGMQMIRTLAGQIEADMEVEFPKLRRDSGRDGGRYARAKGEK